MKNKDLALHTNMLIGVLKWLNVQDYTFLHFQKVPVYRFIEEESQNHACLKVILLEGTLERIQKFQTIFCQFLVTSNMLGRAVLIHEFGVSHTLF